MARPRRNQGSNLRSAGLSLANSTARITGRATEKAAVGLFKWAVTDHTGMSSAMSNLPLLYDNTDITPRLIANGSREKVECVTDTAVWNRLKEFNDER